MRKWIVIVGVLIYVKSSAGSVFGSWGKLRFPPSMVPPAGALSLDIWGGYIQDGGNREFIPGPFVFSGGGSRGIYFFLYGSATGKPALLYQGESYDSGFGIGWRFLSETKKRPFFNLSFRAGNILSGWDTLSLLSTGKTWGKGSIQGGAGYLNIIDVGFPRSNAYLFVSGEYIIKNHFLIEGGGFSILNESKEIAVISCGARYYFTPFFSLGVIVEGGITRPSPDISVFLSLRFTTVREGELDSDNDGILNAYDMCPSQPEDKDRFMDNDGCPDYDNDNDGIPDELDPTPYGEKEPEKKKKYKSPTPELKIKGPQTFLRKPKREFAILYIQPVYRGKPIPSFIYTRRKKIVFQPKHGFAKLLLEKGIHRIKIKARGMKTKIIKVRVESPFVTYLRPAMKRIPFGGIAIKVENYFGMELKNAEVYVIGKRLKKKLKRKRGYYRAILSPRKWTFSVKAPGYSGKRFRLKVKSGKWLKVKIKLLPKNFALIKGVIMNEHSEKIAGAVIFSGPSVKTVNYNPSSTKEFKVFVKEGKYKIIGIASGKVKMLNAKIKGGKKYRLKIKIK